MPDTTLPELLRAAAREHGSRPALLVPGRPALDHAALTDALDRLLVRLGEFGLAPGDPVAVSLPAGPELALLLLALASGATACPLNPEYREAELEFYLADLEPRALVVRHGVPGPARGVAERLGIPVLELEPSGLELIAPGGPVGPRATRPARPEDTALVLHTSGTTSRPKRVPLTHRNVCATASNLRRAIALEPEDVCLNVMPLFHVGGLVDLLVPPLAAGGAVVVPGTFSAPDFGRWSAEFRPTWSQVVPAMAHELLETYRDRPGDLDPGGGLRFLRVVAAALPPDLQEEFERVLGLPLIEVYGMTETATLIATNPLPPGPRKPGSVGRPAGPEVALLGEGGIHREPLVPGEVLVRGPSVMPGYLTAPGEEEDCFVEGWFRTGDLGYLDGDGDLFLTGRVKDLVNRGGEKVHPVEVEEALTSHPAVREAACCGVPHPSLGEEVAAAYVLEEGRTVDEDELVRHAAGRLAHFKVPRRLLRLDRIPRTHNGKLRRSEVAALVQAAGPRRTPAAAGPGPGASAPGTPLGRLLASLWCRALELDEVPADAHFFDLGGDSLKAATLVNELQELGGEPLFVTVLFDAPTLGELEAHLLEHHPALAERLLGRLVARGAAEQRPAVTLETVAEFERSFVRHLAPEPPPGPRNGPMVFLLCPPRSGSTLLRVMLAANPALFAPPELYLLDFEDLGQRRRWFRGGQRGHLEGNLRALMELEGIDADAAGARMEELERRGLGTREYYALLQELAAPRLLVDKTPFYGAHPEALARAEAWFEGALFVHLVRHPYGMIRSFEELRMQHLWYPRLVGEERAREVPCPYGATEMGELVWLMVHRNALRLLEDVPAGRRHRIAYEDLVQDPRAELERLCGFLGVPFDTAMLEPGARRSELMTDGIHTVSQMIGDVKFHRHEGISTASAHRWREHYERDFLGEDTWRLAEELGYGERIETPQAVEEFEF